MPYTKEQAKQEVQKIVDRYKDGVQSGRAFKLTEEETKKDFILPLFKVLNWDTESSQEVSAEETISKSRVDYGFRIDGRPKIFLEAKSIKANLDDVEFAKQAINYAWLKSTTWAVLTDFQSLKVFNAEWESTSPLAKMFFELDWDEYTEKFDKLWLLSKDSFLFNEIDKVAEEWGKKQKRTPVTPVMKQIFNDLMMWREKLTKNISSYSSNSKVVKSEEELDESVQRIIDRLIFIRVCEDRGIENVVLQSKVREWQSNPKKDLIKILNEIFREFDKSYNSKLFAPHPSEELTIDNSILVYVINNLYESSDRVFKYDFSAIEADVLGNIYEEYLGYILQKISKKPSEKSNHTHRKEMGIYYTPTFVVDYIVKNTVGELLKEISSTDIGNIKILDMACGSGSFLIKAFDVLNRYHKNKNELDFLRKIKILTGNIYGVDLDPKAIEISQLNLLLKTLEKRKLLPKLQENLRVGNSLIDSPEISERAFKWDTEFSKIIDKGGFDAIVGNPPYGAELNEKERSFIAENYEKSKTYKNTALIFIERALPLLKDEGYLGFIVPKSLAFSQLWKGGRDLIKPHLEIVVDVSKAFKDVLLEQVIIVLKKNSKSKSYRVLSLPSYNGNETFVDKKFIDSTDSIIVHGDSRDFHIFEKMISQNMFLSDISKTTRGIPMQKHAIKNKSHFPIIRGQNISRFNVSESGEYLPDSLIDKNNKKIKELLQPKIVSQRIVAHVTKPTDHIIIMSAMDEGNLAVDTVENTVITDKNYSPEFLVCLLNSKMASWYAYRYIFSKAIRTMDLDDYYIGKIPIPKAKEIDMKYFSESYQRIMSLHKSLQQVNKLSDRGKEIQVEIKKVEKEIDNRIYELYKLSKDEIEIIENS